MFSKLKLVFAIVSLSLVVAACGPWPDEPAPPDMTVVEHAIQMHFSPYGDHVVREALNVAWCESTHNPNLTNGQYLGLFQMGKYHYWRFEGNPWNDPYVNARAAGGLYAEQGWRPWECKPWTKPYPG